MDDFFIYSLTFPKKILGPIKIHTYHPKRIKHGKNKEKRRKITPIWLALMSSTTPSKPSSGITASGLFKAFLDQPLFWLPLVIAGNIWRYAEALGAAGLRRYWIFCAIDVVFDMLTLMVYYRLITVGYYYITDAYHGWWHDQPRTQSLKKLVLEEPKNKTWRWFLNILTLAGIGLYIYNGIQDYIRRRNYANSLFPLQNYSDLIDNGFGDFSID